VQVGKLGHPGADLRREDADADEAFAVEGAQRPGARAQVRSAEGNLGGDGVRPVAFLEEVPGVPLDVDPREDAPANLVADPDDF
jgi:hypothetical protein